MPSEIEVAQIISKKLDEIALAIQNAGTENVKSSDLIAAIGSPWVCIVKPGTGEWKMFNTETLEWGGPC